MKKYFAYDPNDGFYTFDTIEARDTWAEKAVDAYLDGDGWSEEVEQVRVGEITGRAVQCDVRHKPNRDDFKSEEEYDDAVSDWGGDPEFDTMCNYKLAPLSPAPETKAGCGACDKPGEHCARPYGICDRATETPCPDCSPARKCPDHGASLIDHN